MGEKSEKAVPPAVAYILLTPSFGSQFTYIPAGVS
jgi:hypothetical protein